MQQQFVRNFCIIAHIDHGKSTLADRLLEFTGTIQKHQLQDQIMDQMELERERGITIKAKAVRMIYRNTDSREYELNLIDTPGHVDFSYEVSRTLAACEGAIVVVDASQGIQAQTLSNVYMAMEHDLVLIPVINKIDLENARPESVAADIEKTLGFKQGEMIFASAREGTGTEKILQAVVQRIPPPAGKAYLPLRALIFDSKYDPYKGIVAYVRIVDGYLKKGDKLRLISSGISSLEALEIGIFTPWPQPIDGLKTGEVGYIATGLKDANLCQVGDTITLDQVPDIEPLPGFRPAKPMVFAGIYPIDANKYPLLREALDKLKLNDASLTYQPESSAALGFGFRCGFLGLLHLDIVRERLEREYDIEIVITAPGVEYVVTTVKEEEMKVHNPSDMPPTVSIKEMREPWVNLNVITPSRYIGVVMELLTERRGEFKKMEYLGLKQTEAQHQGQYESGVLIEYGVPLNEILVDFYDRLKSVSQGYASMDYHLSDYRPAKLVKLDILLNGQPVDALSVIVPSEKAYAIGRALVEKLRGVIPRQLFEVVIQAAINSRVIAKESIKPMRKNVLAKCYGGDVTRKRKLLQKQAEGKKRMKKVGRVEIPQEAFAVVLKLERK